MSEHTPGPWAIEEDHDDIADTVMIHGAADAPGLVPVALVYTANAFPCVDENREAMEVMCKADACLIAAAPDLLEALTRVADALWDTRDESYSYIDTMNRQMIVAAIAKAKGEQGA